MANLDFCDKHNMVAYLQKSEGSEGFHQIVDFLNTCHIKYALIENPTIYVSLIEQFWQTATARTLENGDMEITATIDGKVKIVSEASIRRHLKLEDSDGISTLPTTEIFEQLALMGVAGSIRKRRIRPPEVKTQQKEVTDAQFTSLAAVQQRSYMCNYIKAYGKVNYTIVVKVPKVVAGSSKRSAKEEIGEEKMNLVKLWDLVRERFSSTEPTDEKERALWFELKRLLKPDTNDLLELQRYMHDPLTWRLYDICGVHQCYRD
ncbi:hypothetical protein Tco_0716783 [Tanacetum coccineum]